MNRRFGAQVLTAPVRSSIQYGMSVIEVLVAAAVISIMSLSVAYFSSFKAGNLAADSIVSGSTDQFNCQAQVNSILSSLRSEGQAVRMTQFYPHSATDNTGRSYNKILMKEVWPAGTTPSFMPSSFSDEEQDLVRWTEDASNPGFGDIPQINLAALQRSSVRLIESIYEKNRTTLCLQPKGGTTSQLSDLAKKYESALLRSVTLDGSTAKQVVETKFRIVPYEVATGTLLNDCPQDLHSVPLSTYSSLSALATDTNGATAMTQRMTNQTPDRVPHIGYLVEVHTEVSEGGKTKASCTGSQRFEHQIDERPPTPASVQAIVLNNTLPTFNYNTANNRRNWGSSQSNQVQILFRIDNPKPGTILLCRDLSKIPKTSPADFKDAANPYTYNSVCMGASPTDPNSPGPGPQRLGGTDQTACGCDSNAPNAVNLRIIKSILATTDTSNKANDIDRFDIVDSHFKPPTWIPCDQVTVCRKKPKSSKVTVLTKDVGNSPTALQAALTKSDSVEFINTYENLRAECVMQLEVAVTDQAGNLVVTNTVLPAVAPANILGKAIDDKYALKTSGTANITPTQIVNSTDPLNVGEVARNSCGNWCTQWSGSNKHYDVKEFFGDDYGAGGYWQPTCCVSPKAPPEIVQYIGVYSDGTLTPAAKEFVRRWNKAYACRPGWNRGSSDWKSPSAILDAYPLAANSAVKQFKVSQDYNANSTLNPQPYVATLDKNVNFNDPSKKQMADNLDYLPPGDPYWSGLPDVTEPACGSAPRNPCATPTPALPLGGIGSGGGLGGNQQPPACALPDIGVYSKISPDLRAYIEANAYNAPSESLIPKPTPTPECTPPYPGLPLGL